MHYAKLLSLLLKLRADLVMLLILPRILGVHIGRDTVRNNRDRSREAIKWESESKSKKEETISTLEMEPVDTTHKKKIIDIVLLILEEIDTTRELVVMRSRIDRIPDRRIVLVRGSRDLRKPERRLDLIGERIPNTEVAGELSLTESVG